MSVNNVWTTLRKSVSKNYEKVKQEQVDSLSSDAEPELCIRLIARPTVQNYTGIKTKLKKSSKEWMEEFVKLGGLEVLFLSLEKLCDRNIFTFVDAFIQVEAVHCVKAVINSKAGLEYMIEKKDFTRTLTAGTSYIHRN